MAFFSLTSKVRLLRKIGTIIDLRFISEQANLPERANPVDVRVLLVIEKLVSDGQ
ncbi:hypothetical protein FH063_000815 [Azospirillum argentinense]|uniref:Uncharacterized protein n=1 Tax=Azospirillum argentinense TaxID=2970906 RepID=A0A5B0L2V7_9PROT|nr:hypothetical protein FH063_000815 [Azospirillum argentinense]